ncbi:Ankyrin repeat protein 1 [Giardia muris]|uniref:Ankyrin repeat protein 1 n=1 Tax=Giardia muris TaxID=5742 RepID=A0A4Z1SN54_GIAMU|nr:Ankyrin repeat protein 1 [Giardia muris]|eukprot:TNJ27172.1 Ankyrin repeat protein 1 [Giardia muris]
MDGDRWFHAVRSRNTATVLEMLPVMARTQDSHGETALMVAAATNNIHLCRSLAPHEHSLVNHRGYTALAIAALRNHAAVCQLLVKYEHDVPLPKGRTPLMLAIQSESADAEKVLRPYYTNVKDQPPTSETSTLRIEPFSMIDPNTSITGIPDVKVEAQYPTLGLGTTTPIPETEMAVEGAPESFLLSSINSTAGVPPEMPTSARSVHSSGKVRDIYADSPAHPSSSTEISLVGSSHYPMNALPGSRTITVSDLLVTAPARSVGQSHCEDLGAEMFSIVGKESSKSVGRSPPVSRRIESPTLQSQSQRSQRSQKQRPGKSETPIARPVSSLRLAPSPSPSPPRQPPRSLASSRSPLRAPSSPLRRTARGDDIERVRRARLNGLRAHSVSDFVPHSSRSPPGRGTSRGEGAQTKAPWTQSRSVYEEDGKAANRSVSTIESRHGHRYDALIQHYARFREDFDSLRQIGERMSVEAAQGFAEMVEALKNENAEKTAEIERLTALTDSLLQRLTEAGQTMRASLGLSCNPSSEKRGSPIPGTRCHSAPRRSTQGTGTSSPSQAPPVDPETLLRHIHSYSNLSMAGQAIIMLKDTIARLETENASLKSQLDAANQTYSSKERECVTLEHRLKTLEQNFTELRRLSNRVVQRDSEGNTRLIRSIAFRLHPEPRMLQLLIRDEAGVANNRGQTALMYAAATGCEDVGLALVSLESGHQDNVGLSALMISAQKCLPHLTSQLVPFEAGLREKKAGETTLMLVARNGVLDELRGQSDDPTVQGGDAVSLELRDRLHAMLDAIHQLVEVEGGMKSREGLTALMLATQARKNSIIPDLVEKEAKMRDGAHRTALMIAVQLGNYEAAQLLIPYEKCLLKTAQHSVSGDEASPTDPTPEKRQESSSSTDILEGTTALMQAAFRNEYDMVQLLMPHEAGISAQNGWVALDYSVVAGHTTIAELLRPLEGITLENVAAIDTVSMQEERILNGKTQLMQMVKQNRPGLVYCLLDEAGFQDQQGMTALMHATLARNHPCIRLLLAKEKRMQNAKGETALMLALLLEDDEAIRLLAPHEQGIQDADGTTALMVCAYNNYLAYLPLFIEQEAGKAMIDGKTALMLAAEKGHKDACLMLAKSEMNISKADGTTAFLLAHRAGFEELALQLQPKIMVDANGNTGLMNFILEQQKEEKANDGFSLVARSQMAHQDPLVRLKTLLYQVGTKNKADKTALMLAVEANNYSIVKALRKLEAKLTTSLFVYRTWKLTDATALIMAACYGHLSLVQLLAKTEARIAESSFHRTALMAAAYFNHYDCVEVLMHFEAGMQRREGSTALMLAVAAGYYDIASLLARSEANLFTNEKSTYGQGASALVIAAAMNNVAMVELLAPYEAVGFGQLALQRTTNNDVIRIIKEANAASKN